MTRLLAGVIGHGGADDRLVALATDSAAVERLSERLAVLLDQAEGPEPQAERRRGLLDGVLFNAAELARELGLPAQTAPGEIVAAGFERHGEAIFTHLRGNFVTLVRDGRKGRTLLACDQLGARSLFFKRSGGTVLFASEAHLLLRLLPRRPEPDDSSLVRWLVDTSIPPGRTLYAGVERLGGGQLLSAGEGTVALRRYWAPRYSEPAPISLPEGADAARVALSGAIRRQLPQERRYGVLLSGGLDSTSVAALARAESSGAGSPRAYSALFPEHSSIDESELIAEAAGGLDRTTIAVRGGSMVRGALEYQQRWELPSPAPNHFLWQPLLERAASEGTSVMLDGEGGDELWKFSPYLLADLLSRGHALAATRLTREMLGTELYRGWRSAVPYLRLYGLKGAIPLPLHHALRRLHPAERYAPQWLSRESALLLASQRDEWGWKRLPGPRWWAYMADLLTGVRERLGVGDYLRHRSAMAGLEGRHPLIDLDLVEFALGLPPRLAIDPRLERPVQREAIAGLVPDSIRLRPSKSYFSALFHDCLEGRDAPLIHRLLTDSPEIGRYVDLEAIQRNLLGEPAPGTRRAAAWPWSVWRLVTAECWLRGEADSDFAGRLLEECEPRRDDWALSSLAG